MNKSTEKLKEVGNRKSRNRETSLVLSIDQNGKIVQLNKECEKITGYNRYEVLNRELFDFLIPKQHLEQWIKIFDSLKQNRRINDLKLPWLTYNGQEIIVSWTIFLVESGAGNMENICFVGRPVIARDFIKEPIIEHVTDKIESKVDADWKNEEKFVKKEENTVLFKFGNKRIVFRKSPPHRGVRDIAASMKIGASPKKEYSKNRPMKTFEREKINEGLVDRYGDINKTIGKLEKRDEDLEKEYRRLEITLENVNAGSGKKTTKDSFNRGIYLLFDYLGGKIKKEEIEKMMRELDERKAMLNNLESQVLNEKKNFSEIRTDLCIWREKLEFLEEEIEKRRNEVVDREKMLKGHFIFSVDKESGKTLEHLEILDKIPECAAVVQRGILKQINGSFAEMLGYGMEEVVGKSLFDFVVPEWLSEIERYYLDRLKGSGSSSYETVFLTKDNNKVAVEVSTKPTTINGEKAEIAVIKRLENQIKESK
jgi:PAS domain S-box-containing protein